jgi:hypothetical protein
VSYTGFADPIKHALTLLRAEFTDVTFGNESPDPEVDGRPPLPFVAVSLDFSFGQPQSRPVRRIANLRLVAWHEDPAQAQTLVQKCEAHLLAFRGDAEVQGYGEISGPLPYANGGNPICVITVAARLRPITL